VFGGDQKLGAKPRPVPTTFGQGAGELADDLDVPKSRKGLMIGVAGAVLAAGLGAFLVLGRGGDSATEAPLAKPAEATQPVVPAKPATVGIKFNSAPTGAKVVQKSNGAVLGTTPFEHEFDKGTSAIEVILRKAGFEDKALSFVPDEESRITTELAPVKPEAPPEVQAKPVAVVGKPIRGKPPAVQREPVKPFLTPPKPRTKKGPLDEDAVLEPSFE